MELSFHVLEKAVAEKDIELPTPISGGEEIEPPTPIFEVVSFEMDAPMQESTRFPMPERQLWFQRRV